MPEITPDTLLHRLETGDAPYLLDIRHAPDFEDWHIPGSENIDVYDELDDDPAAAQRALADIPRDEEIVTVCAAGVRSARATDLLRRLGYEAYTLVDGMGGWSRVHRHAPVDADLDGRLVQVARPGKGCLSYLLVSGGEAAVFDASAYVEPYEALLDDSGADLVGVFDTHAHADHVSGGHTLADRHGVAYHLHPDDALALDATPLREGHRFVVGEVDIEVLHTPGHSPGSVTFDVGGAALLTGDTLFHESVGRVELGVDAGLEDVSVETNAATLFGSLQRLLDRDGDPLVLPTHDPGTPLPPVEARLSDVVARNPKLGRDREALIAALSADVPAHPPNFRRVKRVNAGLEEIDPETVADLETGPNRCAAT